ncbi:ccr4-not transcription complex [Anaeramoeba ignava]|uniref:Ccr4-not transcription complex n=1 Tax=Anaeramoeba ignava TaxID=1746090 RepID=A0A9Q0LFH6_ANAIG|nr:ccr4-not transcription complex [Anaeramoeba ignava]
MIKTKFIQKQIFLNCKNLNKKSYRIISQENDHLIELYGKLAQKELFKSLIFHIFSENPQINEETELSSSIYLQLKMLKERINSLIQTHNNYEILFEAFESLTNENLLVSKTIVQKFRGLSKLNQIQEILFFLAMNSSPNSSFQNFALQYFQTEFSTQSKNIPDLDEKLIYYLVIFLKQNNFDEQQHPLFKNYLAKKSQQTNFPYEIMPLINEEANFTENSNNVDISTNLNTLFEEILTLSSLINGIDVEIIANKQEFMGLLSQLSPINAQEMAKAITEFANKLATKTEKQEGNGFKKKSKQESQDFKASVIGIFADTIKEKYPEIKWSEVMKKLDYSTFRMENYQSFMVLMEVFKRATSRQFSSNFLLSKWVFSNAQLSFLSQACKAPVELINFAAPSKQTNPHSSPMRKSPDVQHQAWGSIPFLELLFDLSEHNFAAVLDIFSSGIEEAPEMLIENLWQISPKTSYAEIMSKNVEEQIITELLDAHPESNLILQNAWNRDAESVIQGMIKFWILQPSSLSKVLDVALDLKGLLKILDSPNLHFVFELATLTSRRECLNLEKWLNEKISNFGSSFYYFCLDFLVKKLHYARLEEDHKAKIRPGILLSVEIYTIFFKCLFKFANSQSEEYEQKMRGLFNEALQLYPQLYGYNLDLFVSQQFPKQVEDKANYIFSQIFKQIIPIENSWVFFTNLKNSRDTDDMQTFECIVYNLLVEYRYFDQYPDPEFGIVAELYAILLKHDLLDDIQLFQFLKNVVVSLNHTIDTKIFLFGVNVLRNSWEKLTDWINLGFFISQNPNLRQYNSQFAQVIEQYLTKYRDEEAENKNQTFSVTSPKVTQEGQTEFHRVNGPSIPTIAQESPQIFPNPPILVSSPQVPNIESQTQPMQQQQIIANGSPVKFANPSENQARIYAQQNTENENFPKPQSFFPSQNAQKTILFNENLPIPVKPEERIFFIFNVIDHNSVESYCKELKKLIYPQLVEWTVENIFIRRASHQPNNHDLLLRILAEIDLKDLDNYLLSSVYIHISKLLEIRKQQQRAIEFSLKILHNLGKFLAKLTLAKNKPILQKYLNIKFILLESLGTGDFEAIVPFITNLLSEIKSTKVFHAKNPWVLGLFHVLIRIWSIPQIPSNIQFDIEGLFKNLSIDMNEILKTIIRKSQYIHQNQIIQISNNLRIDNQIDIFHENPKLKDDVINLFLDVIEDIISNFIENMSESICMTTKQIIAKDFANESNWIKMKESSEVMASSLARNLAMVHGKQVIEQELMQKLRYLLEDVVADTSYLQGIIAVIYENNIDFVFNFIIQISVQQTLEKLNEELTEEFQIREEYQKQGKPFANTDNSPYSRNLIEELYPENGLMNFHFEIYQSFRENLVNPKAEKMQYSTNRIGDAINDFHQKTLSFKDFFLETQKWVQILAILLDKYSQNDSSLNPNQISMEIKSQIANLERLILSCTSYENAALIAAQLVCKQFFQQYPIFETTSKKTEISRQSFGYQIYLNLMEHIHIILQNIKLNSQPKTLLVADTVQTALTNQLLARLQKSPPFDFKMISIFMEKDLIDYSILDELFETFFSDLANTAALDFFFLMMQKFQTEGEQKKINAFQKSVFKLEHNLQQAQSNGKQNKTAFLGSKLEELVAYAFSVFQNVSDNAQQEEQHPNEEAALKENFVVNFRDWVYFFQTNQNDSSQMKKTQKIVMKFRSRYFTILTDFCVNLSVHKNNNNNNEEQNKDNDNKNNDEQNKNNDNKNNDNKNSIKTIMDIYADLDSQMLVDPSKLNHQMIDMYSQILIHIVKNFDDPINPDSNIVVMKTILDSILESMVTSYYQNAGMFCPNAYKRILTNLLILIQDQHMQRFASLILRSFYEIFDALQPINMPWFTFSWICLISSSEFLPYLLQMNQGTGSKMLAELLANLLKFLYPYLKLLILNRPIRLLYKATLRIFLVLLHDFPNFLCSNYIAFSRLIPDNCIHLKNLVLSAKPTTYEVPDYSLQNGAIESIPGIAEIPSLDFNFLDLLSSNAIKNDLVYFLEQGKPQEFLLKISRKITDIYNLGEKISVDPLAAQTNSLYFDGVLLIDSLIISICYFFMERNRDQFVFQNAIKLFTALLAKMETRYLILNSIANHLRDPNAHTRFFSDVMIIIFSNSREQNLKETITRVLLERALTREPHPWGVMFTFQRLTKDQMCQFWDQSFITKTMKIQKFLERIRKSIK